MFHQSTANYTLGVLLINSTLHSLCFTSQQHTTPYMFHQSTAHYTVGISPVTSTLHSGYFTSQQHTTQSVFHQSTAHYTLGISPVNNTLHSLCFTSQQHTTQYVFHQSAAHEQTTHYQLSVNVFSDSSPACHSDLLTVYTPSRQLRSSADTRILRIPHVRTKTLSRCVRVGG